MRKRASKNPRPSGSNELRRLPARIEGTGRAGETFREEYDSGDPWGSVMGAWFNVADALNFVGERGVPDRWQYRAGAASGAEEGNEYARMLEAGEVSEQELTVLGDWLQERSEALREQGFDY